MDLDMDSLGDVHPRLGARQSAFKTLCAALALDRAGHRPGVRGTVLIGIHASVGRWKWTSEEPGLRAMFDEQRVTEEGAEAVALLASGLVHGWEALRRLQQGQGADWVLLDRGTGQEVVLEVSGVRNGPIRQRLAAKVRQTAERADETRERWVCVVGFEMPWAHLKPVDGGDR